MMDHSLEFVGQIIFFSYVAFARVFVAITEMNL